MTIPKKKYTVLEAELNNLINPDHLDSKDKKYLASIDKSLANFEAAVEWADYISFLSRLIKALSSHTHSHWIPQSVAISKCLSKCLSSSLPSGVHRKALEVYETIFKILGKPLLAQQLNLWIPGILPLMSYAAIGVKPVLIGVLDRYVLDLPPNYLKVITKVLILSLLPGIDDESSESFDATWRLLEKLQKNLNDITHFWQCFFMAVITSKDRRLGALIWCAKKLPSFSVTDGALSEEAAEIVSQETGLIIRAFVKTLDDDQILVQRGFFDIMIAKLKLSSVVLTDHTKTSKDDTESLIMSACLTVLRKDMSLNRRLWNWLLGTDDSISTPMIDLDVSHEDKSSDLPSKDRMMTRIKYFTDYGQQYLVDGFLKLINSNHLEDRIKGYKVSLAFMDKWEIGLLITSKIFVPFLRSVQTSLFESNQLDLEAEATGQTKAEISAKKSQYDELFKSASAFFDTIESMSIWSTCFHLIDGDEDVNLVNDNLKLLLFIVKSFNVNEEDMVVTHLPLMVITLLRLKIKTPAVDIAVVFDIIKEILAMIPAEALAGEIPEDKAKYLDGLISANESSAVLVKNMNAFQEGIYNKIKSFYQDSTTDEKEQTSTEDPLVDTHNVLNETLESTDYDESITQYEKSVAIFVLLSYILCKCIEDPQENIHFYTYSLIYTDLLDKVPIMDRIGLQWKDSKLNVAVEKISHSLISKEWKKSAELERSMILSFYGGLGDGKNLLQDLKSFEEEEELVDDSYVSITFGINKLFPYFVKSYSEPSEKMKLLKSTLELLYTILISPFDKYKIEAINFLFALELSCQSEYIQAGITSIFSKLHENDEFEKIIKIVKILWSQISSNSLDTIIKKPLFLVLDELKNGSSSNKLIVADWISSNILKTNSDRLLNIIISPLLEFKFLYTGEIDLIDDFEYFDYYLKTVIGVLNIDKAQMQKVLSREVTQIDSILDIIKNDRSSKGMVSEISTYKSLLIYLVNSFLRLKLNSTVIDQTGYEVFESDIFNKTANSALILLGLILDATEPNADHVMSELIYLSHEGLRSSSKRTRTSNVDQLIYIHYFNIISGYISKCHHHNKKLSIFNINPDIPIRPKGEIVALNYIEYLIFTLDYIRSPLVFKFWVEVLVDNLINLSDCIFQVVLPLTETICSKIRNFFKLIKYQMGEEDKIGSMKSFDNVDQVIGFLMSGLQELLNYSHMFLSASEAKPKNSLKSSATDPGFLTSVMSGVFSVESPDAKGFEETNRFTVLLAFESTISVCFEIWLWGESKTSIAALGIPASKLVASPGVRMSLEVSRDEPLAWSKSLEHVASKVKYKSRDLMEKLYRIEPLQVLHTAMAGEPEFSNPLFKILHILDNSRPQLTIPYIFDSIKIKTNPDGVKTKYKSSLISKFTENRLGVFLVEYLKSLDIGVIEDVYPESIIFLKDVISLPLSFRSVLPFVLEFCSVLIEKLSKLKFGEQKKVRKEVSDCYLRVLSYTLSRGVSRSTITGEKEKEKDKSENSDNEVGAENVSAVSEKGNAYDSQPNFTREDICTSLSKIIPSLDNAILQEGEKVSTIVSSIILNAIQPSLKVLKISELPDYVMDLILRISESPASDGNKIWRSLIYEIFTDADFFNVDISVPIRKQQWEKIIRFWINDDVDRLEELITKVQPYNGNSSTLFNWNEGETHSKVLKLKRITYLIMISSRDQHLNLLNDIVSKYIEILSTSKNELHYQAFLGLRALVLRFSETHLNQFWVVIYSELENAFKYFILEMMQFEEKAKEDADINDSVDVQSILSASKLLDVILTIGFEEFNLDQWIFIDDSLETISGGLNVTDKVKDGSIRSDPLVVGLIDKISRLKSYKLPDADDERKVAIGKEEQRLKQPLLYGYSKLEGVELLKPFFDSLSYRNFERVYGLKSADISKCEEDVIADMFTN